MISKLNIQTYNDYNVRSHEVLELAKQHPMIVELNLPNFIMSAGIVFILIEKLPLLKLLRFQLSGHGRITYIDFVNQLNEKWQHEINVNKIITLKC